jgi:hypothetical protein
MVYKRGGNKYYSLMFRKEETTLEVLNTTSSKHDTILIVDDIEKKEENKHINPKAIKRFIDKVLTLPGLSQNIPAYMYQGFLEIQNGVIPDDKIFFIFKESYNKIKTFITDKILKGNNLANITTDTRTFIYEWTKAYNEYSINVDCEDQIEASADLLKKLERIFKNLPPHKSEVKTQNLNEINKTPLEQEEKEKLFFSSIGKDIQTKLQNLKDIVKTPLEQGKEMKILYRGKPKIITIINKYTKNDKEYAVITDHTDNDKTKTLFTSYIELTN